MAAAEKKHVKSVILFINMRKKNAEAAALEISAELERRGIKITYFAIENFPDTLPQGKWDVAFSLGGDGTVLYAARSLARNETPILPLHLGTFGFIAGIEKDEWLSIYEQWLKGTARISRRCMLDIFVKRCGSVVYNNTCLNDAVISSTGIASLIRLHARAEVSSGEFTELGFYRSDGLIISTPTGSTAYSMSAGGPILDPEMEAQILTPVCPFTLSNRPIVLHSRQILHITVDEEQRSNVLLTIDGQDTFVLEAADEVAINHSPHYAQLITTGSSAYYSALREKLGWSGVSRRGRRA